jgi:hypothetical protein
VANTKSGKICHEVIKTETSNEELDTTEPKWGYFRLGAGVFSGREEKEEGKGYHVGDGSIVNCRSYQGSSHDVLDNVHRDRFDMTGWWVLLTIIHKLPF